VLVVEYAPGVPSRCVYDGEKMALPRDRTGGTRVRRDHEDLLRRLALNDEGAIGSALGTTVADVGLVELEPKTHALVRLAALIALGSADASHQWGVSVALAVGVSEDEIVGVLLAVAPVVGLARMNPAASEVALALGLEIVDDPT
jgi:4-carboxymuconolactone decarboxylase